MGNSLSSTKPTRPAVARTASKSFLGLGPDGRGSPVNNKGTFVQASAGLRKIPMKKLLKNVGTLNSMCISGNLIQSIPDNIALLTRLVEVDLSFNRLMSIPEALLGLPLIRILSLSGNEISRVPEDICHLRELHTLKLSLNPLRELPSHTLSMPSMVSLYLDHARYEDAVPPLVPKTPHPSPITSIVLDRSGIAALPPNLSICSALKVIRANENRITYLPDCVCELGETLRTLYLAQNKLSAGGLILILLPN